MLAGQLARYRPLRRNIPHDPIASARYLRIPGLSELFRGRKEKAEHMEEAESKKELAAKPEVAERQSTSEKPVVRELVGTRPGRGRKMLKDIGFKLPPRLPKPSYEPVHKDVVLETARSVLGEGWVVDTFIPIRERFKVCICWAT
jgi:hypothetical protein